jgi:hypothetical protein
VESIPGPGLGENTKEFMRKFLSHNDRINLHEEKEASHIENIIRAEMDPTGQRIQLRLVYSNIVQKTPYLHQIPTTDVVKPGFNYYGAPKGANYRSLKPR